jgi:hypothetical protein
MRASTVRRCMMNEAECRNEKISSRTIGLIILPVGLFLAFIGFLIVPFFGVLFSVPVLGLAAVFLMAPESRVCKLLTGKGK